MSISSKVHLQAEASGCKSPLRVLHFPPGTRGQGTSFRSPPPTLRSGPGVHLAGDSNNRQLQRTSHATQRIQHVHLSLHFLDADGGPA